jgi:hypothetical protein
VTWSISGLAEIGERDSGAKEGMGLWLRHKMWGSGDDVATGTDLFGGDFALTVSMAGHRRAATDPAQSWFRSLLIEAAAARRTPRKGEPGFP